MKPWQAAVKRAFDILLSAFGLVFFSWLILFSYIAATIDTRRNGFFTQERVGRFGKPFRILKLRTMRDTVGFHTNVTTTDDPRITPLGRQLRRYKIDELPQLFNVLLGQMSFVGPRPDVAGFADTLRGEYREILGVRPGITGPATLRFRNEEQLLADSDDPERYNSEVIYPLKTALNLQYVRHYRFREDIRIIFRTLMPSMQESK